MKGKNAQKLEDFFQSRSTDLREGLAVSTVVSAIRDEARFDLDPIQYLAEEGDSSFVSRALLFSVNKTLAPDANSQKLDKSLHLEHIAPKSETDDWKSTIFLGNPEEYSEYGALVSEVGNLTLLDFKINIRAQQKSFEDKKKKYHDSVIKLTRDLTKIDIWTKDEIQARTKWLSECFEILWSVDPTNREIHSFSRWYRERA
jgi:hypothetical protein